MPVTYKVVYTDKTTRDLDLERAVFRDIDAEVIDAEQRSADVSELIADADALVTAHYELDADDIANLAQCKVISRVGIGVDYIDIEACTDHGIIVTNLPEYCLIEVATHTIALILALNRISPYEQHVRDGDWKSKVEDISRLDSQTLGLVGVGNIGRTVSERIASLGLDIIAYDPYIADEDLRDIGVTPVETLDSLLSDSDFVSLHTPLTEDTRHLMSMAEFEAMKPSAYLVNTSRGGLVDESDLHEALEGGLIRGAGLDVLESEPPETDNPLLARDDVVVTPHMAHFSNESRVYQRKQAARNARDVLAGKTPEHVVNDAVLQKLEME
jgi:D-3-phosphoglycerate dehydrogenase